MTPERHSLIKNLFLEALECAEPERAALLDERCRDDADLRLQVDKLLEHHNAATLNPPPEVRHMDSALGSSLPDEDSYLYQSGIVVGQRFRIVAPLGCGGMGEVYRAQDLTLSQEVALKFLLPTISANPAFLERFYQEARVARTITHPNICRVFDVGEADGQHYLSMEYIDGENLGRLIKRIGRVPQDKAVDIARQMCSGVSAAHRRGVLHRDLKPANIMLDGQGQVRITDFGLAGFAQGITGSEIRAGTPAYMAPEQISGTEVTKRSDIYSLGLVLYELFSGHQALSGTTVEDYARLQTSVQPAPLSKVVHDIDPRIESVVMQCLEKDPALRPATVLDVAAALPGGDVLGAMIAAEQTPSPEAVAAARPTEGLVRSPTTLLLIAAGLLVTCLIARPSLLLPWQMPNSRPPATLAEGAREIISALDIGTDGGDSAFGYCTGFAAAELGDGYYKWGNPRVLATGRADDLVFWYRHSPENLMPQGIKNVLFDSAQVLIDDPPHDVPGMVTMAFDSTGRLLKFSAVPKALPPDEEDDARVSEEQWQLLLEKAHISDAQTCTSEVRTIFTAAESRGWTASHPELTDQQVDVTGVGREGSPLFFSVAQAGEFPDSGWLPVAVRRDIADKGLTFLVLILTLLAMPYALINDRSGRGDRIGAMRLGILMFILRMSISILHVPHEFCWEAILQVCYALIRGLAEAALIWVFYMALEPSARRHWPHMEIGWSRALALRTRDAVVGLHVLNGVVAGLIIVVLITVERLLVTWLGLHPRQILVNPVVDEQLLGGRFAIAGIFDTMQFAFYRGLLLLMLLVGLRAVLRRQLASAVIAWLVLVGLYLPYGSGDGTSFLVVGLAVGIAVWAMMRYGLITIIVMIFTVTIMNTFPLTFRSNLWYADLSLLAVAVVVALAMYGWWAASRPPVGRSHASLISTGLP